MPPEKAKPILLNVLVWVLVGACALLAIQRALTETAESDYIRTIIAQDVKISLLDKRTGVIETLVEYPGIAAVEFDAKRNCVFLHNRIFRDISRHCKNERKILVDGVKNSTSLAYDWISNNLYFSDGNQIKFVINNSSYEFENPEKRIRTIFVDGEKTSGWAASNLIVHPEKGYLFWIKRLIHTNRGLIKRSHLDGFAPEVLIGETHIRALHLDYSTNRLHWLHAYNNTTRSCDLNGNDKRIEEKWLGLVSYSNHYCWTPPGNKSKCCKYILL